MIKIKKFKPDILIVGAGPVGCVIAERCSAVMGWKCLIIEKRNHIGGNCYDKKNSYGILYHKYGPHYMRFKKKKIFNYVSKFTKWIKGNYIVKSSINNILYSIPINLNTLEKFFKKKFSSSVEAKKFIRSKQITIKKIQSSEDYILSKLGKEIYEKFYKNYTIKQWGIHPRDLGSEVCGRLPIRYNRNDSYVNEKIKVMPKYGYTKLFKNMLNNSKIRIVLNTDYFKIQKKIQPKIATVYTGPIDLFFNYIYGKLEWRSLDFKFKTINKKYFQKYVQINFPNEKNFTRRVEIKHVTKQKSKFTTLSYEYPKSLGDPYYPINNEKNKKKFNKYKKLINLYEKKNFFFEGRLAQYKYLNMDEVIENALLLFSKLKKKYS
jgi:UDP-galactopyranose mutase